MSFPVVSELGLVDSSITRDVNQSVGEIMECNRIIHSFSSSDRFCVVGISRKGPQVIRSLVRKNYPKVGIKSMFFFNTA